jgi:hypothetical protein
MAARVSESLCLNGAFDIQRQRGAFLVVRPNGLQILGSANVELGTVPSSMCRLCRFDAVSPVKALKSPLVAW